MARNENTVPAVPKKKRDKWCGCFLVVGIILLVMFIAVIAIGLGIGDKVLRQNYDIGIAECFKIIAGIGNADEDDIVTDPVKQQDVDELYSDLRGALFLNDNVDMEKLVSDLLGSVTSSDPGGEIRTAPAEQGEQQPLDLLTQLYSEENVDYTRMRQFINGEKQIGDVYDQEFVLRIRGNSFAGIVNEVLKSSLVSQEQDADLKLIVDNIAVRQLTFSKQGDSPVITIIIKVNVRNVANKYIDDMAEELIAEGVPEWAIEKVKGFVPQNIFLSADLVMSQPAQLNLRINAISDQAMNSVFDLVYKVSDGQTDLKKTINDSVEQAMVELREQMPILFELIENQDNGRVKLDAFGMIAEMLNDNVSEQEGADLSGQDLVAFIAGVLGSDAQNAIEKRLNDDSRYADTEWQTTNADALVATMADSFSLAKTYFVNGTDENGDKIISVENGQVLGVEKMFGRVYSDASGQLYYKKQGGAFKIFISDAKEVAHYNVSGYQPFYSTQLTYKASGKDYTLYRNEDASVIYGVAEDGSVMLKNGTYTELTTLYVDSEGNVYSKQNDQNTYIECKKEALTLDVVMSIANSESLTFDDIIKYVDMTALKLNGVQSWNNPIQITDIQLAAIAGNMLTEQMEFELGSVEPTLRYAVLTEEDGHNFITVGVQLNTAGFLEDDVMASFVGLIGETLYIELVCDVTLGLEQGQYKPTKILYNDLSQEYTDDLLNSISKVVPDMNLNGMLEDLAVEIRDIISSLNENMPLEFGDGVIKLSSPLDLIKPMLVGEDSTITNQQFISSIDGLLHSDADVAVAGAQAQNPDYQAENWRAEGVNQFVISTTQSLGLVADQFLKDGSTTDYSINKIMDIVRVENFGINSVLDKLDYDRFKSEGFTCWSQNVQITDVQLAGVVSEMKDELSSDLGEAGIEIEYAHVSVESGKSFITVGVTADTQALIGGNSLDSLMDIIGDKLYAQLKVDVTLGASEYEDTKLVVNDLSEERTQEVLDLISAIDSSIDITSTFSSVEDMLRSVIEDIDSTLSVEFENGKIVMGKPQQLIFNAIYGEESDYTAEEMVEALTLLATTSDYADTVQAPETDYEQYWNDVLADKYFTTSIGISQLFNSMTSGTNVYTMLKDDFTALKHSGGLLKADGSFRHDTLEDASFKAGSDQLTWLMRANKDSLLNNLLSDPTMFGDVEFASTQIFKGEGNVPGIKMTLILPTASVISEAGISGDTQTLVTNLMGEEIVLEISWLDEEDAEVLVTLNGMTKQETVKFNKMVYELTGINLFDRSIEGYSDSVVCKVTENIKDYFNDYFVLGYDGASDTCYVTMDNIYQLIAEQAFPATQSKDALTAQQVLDVMKNLYELPETDGALDTSKLGENSYTSNSDHVDDIKQYVKSASGHEYEVVAAFEDIDTALLTADLFVTVKYSLSFGGEAGDMMPSYVYITLHCSAQPSISGMSVQLNMQTDIVYNQQLSDENLALNAAFDYYGINVDGALEQAEEQVKQYLLDNYFSI